MKRWMVAVLMMSAVAVRGQSSAWWQGGRPCVILDRASAPALEAGFEYQLPARARGHRKVDTSRWYGRWEGAYFHAVGLGDIDLAVAGEFRTMLRSGGDTLPNRMASLGALALDAGWTWRYVNDTALQLRARPGLYTDFDRLSLRGLYMPVSAVGYWRLHDTLSLMGGVDARMGYEELWLPLAGLAWEPWDRFRLDLMTPASQAEVRWTRRWRTDIGLARQSDSFALTNDKREDPKRVAFKDYRATAGVTRMVNEELFMRLELGWLYNRRIRFDGRGADSTVQLDDALQFGISLAGPF